MKELTYDVIGAAIEVHKILGPGLLERCYELALARELELRGHKVSKQGCVPIIYKGVRLSTSKDDDISLKYDLIVDDSIVIELKSTEEIKPVYFKQLRTYMHFLNLSVGLLFNFNVTNLMKEGFGRVVLNYQDSPEEVYHSNGPVDDYSA